MVWPMIQSIEAQHRKMHNEIQEEALILSQKSELQASINRSETLLAKLLPSSYNALFNTSDIMDEIFHFAISSDDTRSSLTSRQNPTSMNITAVSARWRFLAFSTPRHWGSICLNRFRCHVTSGTLERRLDLLLSRSFPNMLNLTVDIQSEYREDVARRVSSRLLSHKSRWNIARLIVSIEGSSSSPAALLPLNRLPDLRTLTLGLTWNSELADMAPDDIPQEMLTNAPLLRDFAVRHDIFWNAGGFPWSHLRELFIGDYCSTASASILSLCVNLETHLISSEIPGFGNQDLRLETLQDLVLFYEASEDFNFSHLTSTPSTSQLSLSSYRR
ncbi:hypothetical protein DL96DRAFT_1566820 [Flagelloscypha sp. PMI_526]|nr:hypothetical protein DL96DRAFT_1566820 [Flagelloscypha sp. PMI_526]